MQQHLTFIVDLAIDQVSKRVSFRLGGGSGIVLASVRLQQVGVHTGNHIGLILDLSHGTFRMNGDDAHNHQQGHKQAQDPEFVFHGFLSFSFLQSLFQTSACHAAAVNG